jgi:ATPase subunit of ABC transporter with duplicated ATPase domains
MISVSGLAKSFGAQTLFRNGSFQLNPGECYGLVGANGSGKTTLLNILGGDEDATEGSVSIPRKLRLGVLRQDQFLYKSQQVLDVAMMGNRELWEAVAAKERLLKAPAEDFDTVRFSELEETVQRLDGYGAEARAAEILEGLGFASEVHRQPMSTLSGGFKLRVLLAQALSGSPDILLLDEPTNHLDILSIRWLEKFLGRFAGPVVVISHDQRFLDNVVTHILDVDYETVTLYTGNYAQFQQAKAAERIRREKEIGEREREIAHHQKFVDRFRAKASKARQAQSKLRLIEKKADSLEELPASSRCYPQLRFEQRRPSGREVLKVDGIRKAFGYNEVLHGVDLTLNRGDRLAIMGPNGIGKSTLLKILMGTLEADDGSVEWGYETHPGYFAQDHYEQFENPDWTAEEWIAASCPGRSKGFIRGELARVLLSGEEAEKKLGVLSGGEAARLVFCRLAIEHPNVLVLDEPTNHLDLESIEALVDGLQSFDGTLILVSHDRWFVSRLATRIIEIKRDAILDFAGSYEQYVHSCGDDHLDVDRVILKAQDEKSTARRARRSEKASRAADPSIEQLEKRREDITSRIEAGEARLGELDATFADSTFYDRSSPDELRTLESERASLDAQLQDLLIEWEAVEEELTTLE